MTNGPIAFLNDRMIPVEQARLPIHDLGVVLGATVTEMARTFRQRLFRLDGHLARLAGSLECVGYQLDISLDQLGQIASEVVQHNARLVEPEAELGLILFITAGQSAMYAAGNNLPIQDRPTVCIHTFRLPFRLWADTMRSGANLVTPSVRHVPPQCTPASIKHRSRIHYYLADRQAQAIEPGSIPLLLDLEGNVAETNTANILLVERGAIVSPTLDNILPGISRQMVVDLAGDLGIPFAVRSFDPSAVHDADEALLVSTPYCIMPAVQFDGRPIGDGCPGPIFRQLIEAWSKRVGLDVYRQIVEA